MWKASTKFLVRLPLQTKNRPCYYGDCFMEDVRDNFVNECKKIREVSFGYVFVAENFISDADNLQEKVISAIKTPSQGFKEQITQWRSSLVGYRENRNMPLELFHAYFVQAWYGFLDNLFERILDEHFSGLKTYEIKAMQVEFISSEDTPNTLVNNIRKRVWENFSNKLQPKEKLTIIMRALNVDIPETLKMNILEHVAVRNVFQHNRGKLRDRDLNFFKSGNLKYPCGDGEEQGDYYNPNQIKDYHMKIYQVGDTIKIDTVVLDQVYYDLVEAANKLIV
jgi:hypothetical protein